MKSIVSTLLAVAMTPAPSAAGQAPGPPGSPPPRIFPPPAPPGPPLPGSPGEEQQRAAAAARWRAECVSERGIRTILDHQDQVRGAAQPFRDVGRAVAEEVGQAALTVPVDLVRLERALAANAEYQAAQHARRNRDEIVLLRRLSPEDRAIYARSLTGFATYPPARRCPSEPPRR